jgi:hypothetical protein
VSPRDELAIQCPHLEEIDMCNGARFTILLAALVPALAAAYDLAGAVSKLPQSELEKTFWECDFRGTHGRFYGDDGATCSAVTSELNQRRFGDNYEQFLSWWRENKPIAHGQLEAGRATRTDGRPRQLRRKR